MALLKFYRALCVPYSCTMRFPITLCYRGSCIHTLGPVPRETGRLTWESSPRRKPSSRSSSSSSASPSPPRKKKMTHHSKRSDDTEQMEKLWAAVSCQGTVVAGACGSVNHSIESRHSLHVNYLGREGPKEATGADWPQEDMLSITDSEEVGEQELAFPSEDLESDSTSPTVKLPLSAELLPLIKRATAILQMPWPTEGETRQSIFDDEPTISPVSPCGNVPRPCVHLSVICWCIVVGTQDIMWVMSMSV
ncbi:UNVERIFIED_CONTAM: hypothetical protein FKN15_027568 [Acipenser sinensis]